MLSFMLKIMLGFIFFLATGIGGIIVGYKFKDKIEGFISRFKK